MAKRSFWAQALQREAQYLSDPKALDDGSNPPEIGEDDEEQDL